MCEKNNIHLFFIYEDEWLNKEDIVKSMISHKLNITKDRIFARKCTIKELTNKESRIFISDNHIQCKTNASINIGLYYNNELYSVMTFNKRRLSIGNSKINNDIEYDMVRYCNKKYTSVVGGANKLFNYFIKNYKYDNIISFANLDYSDGKIYYKMGFELLEKQPPNYYYVYDGIRKHRFMFRKDKLIKQGYDSNKSTHEIMLERKIYRIYNSGILKFNFKNNG